MEIKIRFRKPKIKQLGTEYKKLKSQTYLLKESLETIPKSEIESRTNLAKKMIKLFSKMIDVQTEIIRPFSPNAAKELKSKVLTWEKIKNEQFSKDYLSNPEIRSLPIDTRKTLIKNMRNDVIDSSFNFIELIQQMNDIVLLACLESVKNTRGKPPKQKDDYINSLLLKKFPDCAKKYQGTWDALESNNPDRYRHASTSTREIIITILGKKKKDREKTLQKFTNSESEIELMESLANTVETIYRTLNKGTHNELNEKMALLSIKVTENIIEYMFEKN